MWPCVQGEGPGRCPLAHVGGHACSKGPQQPRSDALRQQPISDTGHKGKFLNMPREASKASLWTAASLGWRALMVSVWLPEGRGAEGR